jgi:hypothetical protein
MRQRASSPLGDRLYPVTSGWIPLTDIIAALDLYEKHLMDLTKMLRSLDKTDSAYDVAKLVSDTIEFIVMGETSQDSILQRLLKRFEIDH